MGLREEWLESREDTSFVLVKQHDRVRNQAEAIVQSVGWIRKEDRTEAEVEFMNAAIRLLGKKGMG